MFRNRSDLKGIAESFYFHWNTIYPMDSADHRYRRGSNYLSPAKSCPHWLLNLLIVREHYPAIARALSALSFPNWAFHNEVFKAFTAGGNLGLLFLHL
ncbi:hypothetical protein NPIL_172561 [Nephila pilipes]|uniref:Uncharacterized protein n=1 Tax=Nephila pilipes TaxID=299642 RepID=A0A8X6MWT0_NEPPI|nr:hypothetical protein NPIL_172561 [Nephila pilipes]